jgi:hypothetical protein
MGDRAQVHIEDTGVYLYTHWGGHELPKSVSSALAREARWGDPEYLTRIIFDEMTEESHGSSTGHGIGDAQHGDVYRVIHVNCQEQEVTVRAGVGGWHDKDDMVSEVYTFEAFANQNPDWP